jgi:alpha-tubulin suppressor-like RCC1 family protein
MFRFRPSLETNGIAHAVPVAGGTGSSLSLGTAGIYALKVTNTPVAVGGTSSVASTFSIESDVVQVIASGDPQIIQHPLSYVGKSGDRVESLKVYPKTSGKSLFNEPRGLAYDFLNQSLLVVEAGNYSVRRILMGGEVSAIAGSASEWGGEDAALASESRFGRSMGGPEGIAVDGLGNTYVADTLNHTIRKIAANGRVSTIAGGASMPGKVDGSAAVARFNLPSGIACRVVDASTTVLYVADSANHAIRKIQISSGSTAVTTLAGGNGSGYANGNAASARFFEPLDVAYANGIVYVADFQNHAIRAVTDSGTPTVSTLAGMGRVIDPNASAENSIFGKEYAGAALDGVVDQGVSGFSDGTEGTFRFPTGVATDGFNVYVADWGNHLVRKVSLSGDVSTIGGEAGISGDASAEGIKGNSAHFNRPTRVAVDALGNVFVSDSSNHVVRKIAPNTTVTSVAGVDGLPGFLNNDRPVEFYYQWVKGDRVIEGAKSASYVIPELNSASEGVYGVFVSTDPNMNRAIFSALATVRVCPPNTLPSVDVVAGQSAIINRAALVTPLAESAGVALPDWARLDTTGRYLVVSPPVDEPLGTVRTSYDGKGFIVNIVSKLNSGASGYPLILAQPSSRIVVSGSSGQQAFSAIARIPGWTATSNRPTGQWSKLGGRSFVAVASPQAIQTDFKVDLDLGSLTVDDAGFYRLEFSWNGQSVQTDLAQLVVTEKPQILTHPRPVTFIDEGSSIGLSVETRTAVKSLFMNPTGLAYIPERDSILVADSGGHVVRSISKGRTVTKWAGNPEQPGSAPGTGDFALFTQPVAVAYDPGSTIVLTGVTANIGSTTIFADYQDGLSKGLVSASGTIQSFSVYPSAPYRVQINLDKPADATIEIQDGATIAFKRPAMVYVVDAQKHLVRKASLDGVVEEFCGGGIAGPATVSASLQAARFNTPSAIAVDPMDGTVYITDEGNHALRRVRYGTGVVETIAGSVSGKFGFRDLPDTRLEAGTAALMYSPSGVAVRSSVFTPANGTSRTVREVFVSDSMNHAVRLVRINASQSSDTPDAVESVTTWAGYPGASGSVDGLGGDALFFMPAGLALTSQNGPAGELFVADSGNHTIRRVVGELDAKGNYKNVGRVNTAAGVAGESGSADGSARSERLSWPKGLSWNPVNSELYIADTGNFTVRVLSGDKLETYAGQAGGAGVFTSSDLSEFTFQWYKQTSPLTVNDGFEGYQSPTLTKRSSTAGDDGAYWVRVTSMDGSFVDSKIAEVRKKTRADFLLQPSDSLVQKSAQGLIPQGTWIPKSPEVDGIAGVLQMLPVGSFSLSAQLSSQQYLTYRWYRNGEKLSDGRRLSGATVSGADSPELKFEGAGWRNVVAAVAGARHSIAIVADGGVHSVYAWGANDSGQLGLGDRNDRLNPTLIPSGAFGSQKIVGVALSDSFSLARTSDGSLFAWGDNADGQLGNNLVSVQLTPKQVHIGTLRVTQLAAGDFHALAVDQNARVISWGRNTSGQLGRNTPTPWVPDAIESDQRVLSVGTAQGIATIAAGGEHSLFISAAGSVYAFGANARGQCARSALSTTKVHQAALVSFGTLQPGSFASVAAGSIHSVALSAAGSLYAWGGNNKNQLGTSVYKRLTKAAAPGSSTITVENVTVLNAASSFVYRENGAGGSGLDAFEADTAVSSVSANTVTFSPSMTQPLPEKELVLFAERTDPVESPRLVNSAPVSEVILSFTRIQLADALKTYGHAAGVRFRCDGIPIPGATGSLSVGTARTSATATATSGTSTLTVSSTLGLSRGMNVWGTGITDGTVIDSIGAGSLALSAPTVSSIPASTTINFGTLAGVSQLSVAFVDSKTYDVEVFGPGEQQFAVLIPASTISPVTFRSVVAGGSTNFAVTTSNKVLAWGVNERGQFGVGSIKSLSGPQAISALGGRSFANFSTRGEHAFALTPGGQLYAWGNNLWGQLGDGSRQMALLPAMSSFADMGDYRLNIYSSIDGTELSSNPVRIAEPAFSTPKFQPLPVGVTQLYKQASFGGAAMLSIAQPTGYPTPTAFWFDAANLSTPIASGNSYQLTSVVGRREFTVRLGYGTLSNPVIATDASSLKYVVEAFALTAPRIEADLGAGFKRGITSASVVAGAANVKLRAVLDAAVVGVSYQWRRDGVVMHGETLQNLNVSTGGIIRPRQAGVYSVSVSDGINVRQSADLRLTVNGTLSSASDLFTVQVESDDLASLLLTPKPESVNGTLAAGLDSAPKLPAGTALKISGSPRPGTQLLAWSVTSLDRTIEYAWVPNFSSTATYVTPAADVMITPVFGRGYQGDYAGLISTEDVFTVEQPDLNKMRGYFNATVTTRGEVSGRLRVDGELQSFRSSLEWAPFPDLGMSVSDSADGLKISWIQEYGPAELAGLKVGAFVEGIKMSDSSPELTTSGRADLEGQLNRGYQSGSIISLRIRGASNLVSITPNTEWFMRGPLLVSTRAFGSWMGNLVLKTDSRGTQLEMRLSNVMLKNAKFGGVSIRGNELFALATPSSGYDANQSYSRYSVAAAKGRTSISTLGQGGVFTFELSKVTGWGQVVGVLGNGTTVTFSGPIGRRYAPDSSAGFLNPLSAGYNNEIQDVFTESLDVPKAAMVETLKRKTINPIFPIYIPGNLRADLSGILGTLIFGYNGIDGSIGMINRKGLTSEIEYTPNLLVGGPLSEPPTSVPPTSVRTRTVRGYTASSYPQSTGLATWDIQDFVSTNPVFMGLAKGYSFPTTVVRPSFIQRGNGQIWGSFTSTDLLSLQKSKTGLLNRVYAIMLDGSFRAGYGFILRGTTPPLATVIGNLQNVSDTNTEVFRLETID